MKLPNSLFFRQICLLKGQCGPDEDFPQASCNRSIQWRRGIDMEDGVPEYIEVSKLNAYILHRKLLTQLSLAFAASLDVIEKPISGTKEQFSGKENGDNGSYGIFGNLLVQWYRSGYSDPGSSASISNTGSSSFEDNTKTLEQFSLELKQRQTFLDLGNSEGRSSISIAVIKSLPFFLTQLLQRRR
ncbi:unnamed protein product [Fraxinus pennsylvanica]|uniref:Uncharacterized protein n=1 Tax=Fraxinus pennsylvanica TaxID=56036 RepID=A0AAD2E3P6_9LAMI|nr:unnamed protein product [Fraxinus pennsylvanica]